MATLSTGQNDFDNKEWPYATINRIRNIIWLQLKKGALGVFQICLPVFTRNREDDEARMQKLLDAVKQVWERRPQIAINNPNERIIERGTWTKPHPTFLTVDTLTDHLES